MLRTLERPARRRTASEAVRPSAVRRFAARSSDDRLVGAAVFAFVAIGVALRVVAYAIARPLWIDEAMLSLNIATRSYAGLARPLDYDQSATIPFLWAERLAVQLLGPTEYAVRLFPLLAGIAAVLLIWPVARRFLDARGALFATALLALHLRLVYYATEAKQYGIDALVTLVVLALAGGVMARPTSGRRWLLLAAGGTLALLVSQPSVFVLAGAGAALAIHGATRRAPRARWYLAAAAVAWGFVFAALWLLVYRHSASSAYLVRYWEGSYLPYALSSARRLIRGGAFCFGVAVLLVARRNASAAALALPCLALACAALLQKYPLEIRLLVFLAPIVCIAYGAALGFVVDRLPARFHAAAVVVLLAVLLGRQGPRAVSYLGDTMNREDSRDLIRLVETRRAGQPVYVNAFGLPAWLFYTTDWSSPDTARLRWAASIASSSGPAFANAPSRNGPVVGEGAGLQYDRQHGRDLIGVATGMEFRNAHGHSRPAPDPGWARNEVDRIRSVATPYAWVLMSHYAKAEAADLLAAVEGAGGAVLDSINRRGAALYHVCLPRSTPAPGLTRGGAPALSVTTPAAPCRDAATNQ